MTQVESISYRSRLPAELALQLNPAETKMRAVGFPSINAVLTNKLGALISNFFLGFILLLYLILFHFQSPFQVTQFSTAAGQLQLL